MEGVIRSAGRTRPSRGAARRWSRPRTSPWRGSSRSGARGRGAAPRARRRRSCRADPRRTCARALATLAPRRGRDPERAVRPPRNIRAAPRGGAATCPRRRHRPGNIHVAPRGGAATHPRRGSRLVSSAQAPRARWSSEPVQTRFAPVSGSANVHTAPIGLLAAASTMRFGKYLGSDARVGPRRAAPSRRVASRKTPIASAPRRSGVAVRLRRA